MSEASHLPGHFLIAMPSMLDPNFERTVTFICEHTAEGAVGLVINRPMDMDISDVLRELAMDVRDQSLASQPVLQGGPVEQHKGFVLHESNEKWHGTLWARDSIQVTASRQILSALADGSGPDRAALALGYAGWGPGQLEEELLENAWLVVPAQAGIIFETPATERWKEAAGLLGIDVASLAPTGGHA